jgi:hypothetical protein
MATVVEESTGKCLRGGIGIDSSRDLQKTHVTVSWRWNEKNVWVQTTQRGTGKIRKRSAELNFFMGT